MGIFKTIGKVAGVGIVGAVGVLAGVAITGAIFKSKGFDIDEVLADEKEGGDLANSKISREVSKNLKDKVKDMFEQDEELKNTISESEALKIVINRDLAGFSKEDQELFEASLYDGIVETIKLNNARILSETEKLITELKGSGAKVDMVKITNDIKDEIKREFDDRVDNDIRTAIEEQVNKIFNGDVKDAAISKMIEDEVTKRLDSEVIKLIAKTIDNMNIETSKASTNDPTGEIAAAIDIDDTNREAIDIAKSKIQRTSSIEFKTTRITEADTSSDCDIIDIVNNKLIAIQKFMNKDLDEAFDRIEYLEKTMTDVLLSKATKLKCKSKDGKITEDMQLEKEIQEVRSAIKLLSKQCVKDNKIVVGLGEKIIKQARGFSKLTKEVNCLKNEIGSKEFYKLVNENSMNDIMKIENPEGKNYSLAEIEVKDSNGRKKKEKLKVFTAQ